MSPKRKTSEPKGSFRTCDGCSLPIPDDQRINWCPEPGPGVKGKGFCNACTPKSPDQIAVERGFQTLTMVEFSDDDFILAERMAKRLGFTQTAYTTTSALWGLFCLPDRATQRHGCIVKSRELGLLYVQSAEDLRMVDG